MNVRFCLIREGENEKKSTAFAVLFLALPPQTMFAWGESEVFGGWPGAQVAGTETIDGVEYKYFDVPAAAFGQKVNLIFNNNNGGTQIENKAAQKDLVLSQDYFYVVTADDAVFAE